MVKLLFDTNAIIYALNDGIKLPSALYCTSIITEMELFSYAKLSKKEELAIDRLLNYFDILNINTEVKNKAIDIRKNYGIKLPDSIICATAIVYNATLVSNDRQLLKIVDLKMISLEVLIERG